jgi:hypothetical protein
LDGGAHEQSDRARVERTASPTCLLDVGAPDATSYNAGPDAAVECSMPIADIGSLTAGAVLLGACTFPSEIPNSAPSDCVNDSGSPFIVDPFNGTNVPVELQSFSVE